VETKCAIWGTLAEEEPRSGTYRTINSPRAGGKYKITDSIEKAVGESAIEHRLSLTRWLIRQRSFGITEPKIDSYSLQAAFDIPPLLFTSKVNALLDRFGKQTRRMDQVIKIAPESKISSDRGFDLIAYADCSDHADLAALLVIMQEMGLVSRGARMEHDGSRHITVAHSSLTPAGWIRFEGFAKEQASHQGFVAMWFNDEMTRAFEEGIAPAIIDAGYSPMRIDNKQHVNKVDDEIIAEIRRSRFVVSDFTCEPEKPRGGVYFEAGFAMGLAIPVIWTVKDTSLKDLHFDTRQYSHIVWKNSADLREQLVKRIGAVLGDGPLKGKQS
jgi:nucleoside 2-deoxyribosyltransferase